MKNSLKLLGVVGVFCTVSFGCSCTSYRSSTAFQEVVDYYDRPEDSLKKSAAEFLQRYAGYHYGVPRHLTDSAGHRVYVMHPEDFPTDTAYRKFLDARGYRYHTGEAVPDEEAVSREFLTENIELAFDAWRNPWARHVPFDVFCRYILPYRNADEELSDWRRYFKEKYEPTIRDSVGGDTASARQVALYLMRRLRQELAYGTRLRDFYTNFLTPEESRLMHTMECRGLAHYGTLALRACGVPCAMIQIGWRFTDIAHSTIYIPALQGDTAGCRLSLYDELLPMQADKDSMASWRTWRYAYEANPDLVALSEDPEVPPLYYEPVTRMDETARFSKAFSFSLPLPAEGRGKKHLFLCRFVNWKWLPVREGSVEGDSVRFKDASIRQWYRLAAMEGDSLRAFGGTFTLTGQGDIRKYDCTGDTVLFKMVYGCTPDERRLTREVTTYYWGAGNDWVPLTLPAVLWGFNEATGEYRIFEESLRGTFKPVFHLLQTHLPCYTVFFDNETPRPLGFLIRDEESGEGYFMQF